MKFISSYHQIDQTLWNQLLQRSNTPSFFQTPECFSFYCEQQDIEPFLFAVYEEIGLTGLICGYITIERNVLKQKYTKRAIVPGGPLLCPNITHDSLLFLLNSTQRKLKNEEVIYIETRNYSSYESYKRLFATCGFEFQEHLNLQVNTPNTEVIFNGLSASKKREIRLTLQQGINTHLSTSADDMHAFYQILHQWYKTKIKVPLFPEAFFQSALTRSFCKFFVVKDQQQVIGGCLCVEHTNQVLYTWFVCGVDNKPKNIFPNAVAIWSALEYAALNNILYVDMMGAGKPTENFGERDFKMQFGGNLVEHGRFLCVCKPLLYNAGKWGMKILKSI